MTKSLQFMVPWEPSWLVAMCTLAAAILYWRGARGCRVATWPRQLAWWLGLVLVYISLHTHLDYYAQHQFFIHRLQHMVLHHLGPFLMILSRPGVVLRRGMTLRMRSQLLRPLLAWPPVRLAMGILFHPVIAAVLFVGLIYLWLVPPIHFIAMLDVVWYKAMNYSMFVDGLLFWWLVLDRRPRPPAHLSPGSRILLALAVIPPQIVVGAYITFVDRDLYDIYHVCGRVMLNLSAATDQYLGGLILWIPSGMMGVLGALVAFNAWTRLDARGRLPRNRRMRQRVESHGNA